MQPTSLKSSQEISIDNRAPARWVSLQVAAAQGALSAEKPRSPPAPPYRRSRRHGPDPVRYAEARSGQRISRLLTARKPEPCVPPGPVVGENLRFGFRREKCRISLRAELFSLFSNTARRSRKLAPSAQRMGSSSTARMSCRLPIGKDLWRCGGAVPLRIRTGDSGFAIRCRLLPQHSISASGCVESTAALTQRLHTR